MKNDDSATGLRRMAPLRASGIGLAGTGVLAFSFSFPATVWALEGIGPWTATGLRGVIAAILAVSGLVLFRGPAPRHGEWAALGVVAVGCAVGFPLLTTLALQTSTTAHSAVVIGALPMATASISAWRTRQHLPVAFWAAASVGALAVVGFTLTQNHGQVGLADLYLLGALLVCAAGYAEGGQLSSRMAGWRVISWGVVLASPINLVVSAWGISREPVHLNTEALLGMAYIAGVSQFLGFVAWYAGMGLIGVARASQLQLAQPLLTLVWAVLLMGEHLTIAPLITAAVVLACIVITQRSRN